MTDINISVYHIIHFTELIDKSFSSFENLLSLETFKENKNELTRQMIFMNISSQTLIFTDSLREEYYGHFNISNAVTDEEKAKVEQITELLKPVFKKINEWSDIKEFRNNVLTHKLRIRDKGYRSVLTERGLNGYNIPEKAIDFAFLRKCTNLIKEVIYKIFEKEYAETDEKINSDKLSGKPSNPKRDYNKEYTDLISEMKKIQKKIEARLANT